MATEQLADGGLYNTKSYYPFYISLEVARLLEVKEFYGILRRIALNAKIRDITNNGSLALIQRICPHFRKFQQSTKSTALILPDTVEEVYIPSFANSGAVVRSFFLAIVQLLTLSASFIPNGIDLTSQERGDPWFRQKGVIFSLIINRIANKFGMPNPTVINLMWASRETLALLPKFHSNLIFSDQLCMVAGVTIARTSANGNKKWAAKKEYQKELLACIRAFNRPDELVQGEELAAVNAAVDAWSLVHAQAFLGSYGSCAETYPILSMVRKPQPGQTALRLRGLALQPEEFQQDFAKAILASSLATEAKVSMLFPLLFVEACQGCQAMFQYLQLPYDQLGPGEL